MITIFSFETTHYLETLFGIFYEDEDEPVITVIDEDKMPTKGLLIANYTEKEIDRYSTKANHQRFNTKFGMSPTVACIFYE